MGSILGLPFMKKPSAGAEPEPQPKPEGNDSETRLRLYRLIIERYRDEIEGHESKSVSDLRGLVQPHSDKVIEIRDSILEGFRPYVYNEHFLSAAQMCNSYVSSFRTISPPVSFWLGFSEMKELMAGDEIDKSILLCSLIRSIGSENAKIFVTDTKKSYVALEFSGKHLLADHSKKELSECTGWQECLGKMEGKLLYSFSDKEYEDFTEQE